MRHTGTTQLTSYYTFGGEQFIRYYYDSGIILTAVCTTIYIRLVLLLISYVISEELCQYNRGTHIEIDRCNYIALV